jgi:hypothetical protein
MGGAAELIETALRPQTIRDAGLALEEGIAAMRASFRGAGMAVDSSEAYLPELKMGSGAEHVTPVSVATETPAQITGRATPTEELGEIPKRDQRVYIGPRGSDMSPHLDHTGGLATIARVEMGISAGKSVPFVTFKEVPGMQHNWKMLLAEQPRLREHYEGHIARPDPDFDSPGDGFKRGF